MSGDPNAMIEITNLRSGQMLEPSMQPDRMPVVNPATAQTIATVPVGTAEEVDLAVAAAREAFSGWSGLPALERAGCLNRLANLIEANGGDPNKKNLIGIIPRNIQG